MPRTEICLLLLFLAVEARGFTPTGVKWDYSHTINKRDVLLEEIQNVAARHKRDTAGTITDKAECSEVKRLCPITNNSEYDDVVILECLQNLEPHLASKLSDDCQHIIWNHTRYLISDERVRDYLLPVCRKDLQESPCGVDSAAGTYLKCIVSNKEGIESGDCLSAVMRLESVAFYDYKWIARFVKHCDADIEKLRCGRVDQDRLSQSETINCLQDKYAEINEECKREILKLSEIQAEDIKLDRQLFEACSEERERYCDKQNPGGGRVFDCLLQHRRDKLSSRCRQQLLRKQKLLAQDYRISRGLMRSCKDDIKKSHCRRQSQQDDKSIRLAQILLCLENVVRNGSRLDADCEAEMADHRRILMEDYRLSPEIVDGCAQEIKKFCAGGLEAGGKTIHCLMDHARLKNVKRRIGDVCQRALEDLLKETDAAEDWRVDPVLREACGPVVRAACRGVRGGDARTMSCLMDNIGADHMTEECEDALVQIQYFVARDFKLDPQLYRACRDDAARICHAGREWEAGGGTAHDPEMGPLILPCLYRYAYHEDKSLQLHHACFDQIKRAMRQRAISVDLMPHVEEACLDDLGLFCFDKTARGEEILCLQDNLDKLAEGCRRAVAEHTEAEARDTSLNPYVSAHCSEVLRTLCANNEGEGGGVMECLVAHKNDQLVRANAKCRVSIEHFQLISMKDFRFSYKFKVACKPYAVRFCHAAKTKAAVVACLSERVTNDTIAGVKSDVQKECRQQLRAQLFQQRENIRFDPRLAAACEKDARDHCAGIEPGSSQVLECLQSTPNKKLTPACRSELFKIKKQELTDNTVDYALTTWCADAIRTFCPKAEPSRVLDCLRRNRDERGFDPKCLMVVRHRIVEQNDDHRLNPQLQEECRADIRKFCQKEKDKEDRNKVDVGDDDEVIECLKDAFRRSKLSNRCEKEMSAILRERALDLQLNPLLRAVCKDELETVCKVDEEAVDGNQQNAEECLKEALLAKKIPTVACQNEVAGLIEESRADIQVDPPLQQNCALDLLKYCRDIPQGNGRHIKCLKIVMADSTKQLSPDCKNMLTKRLEMYRNAAELIPPADLQQLYVQVVESPAKHYFFLVILMMVGSIFVVGMFCGRASSRRRVLVKNK